MPRAIQDARIQSRTAREKLRPSPTPYYRDLEPGIHVGYRKGKRAGKWVVRTLIGDRYQVATIGTADDKADADGTKVLDWSQAVEIARETARQAVAAHEGRRYGPYSVADAVDDYLDWLREQGRNMKDPEQRLARIRTALGAHNLSDLTRKQIRKWHKGIATSAPLKRGGGRREVDMSDPEVQRRRKDTANRLLNDLKACLNHAFKEGKVRHDTEWRAVRPFQHVSEARARYLSRDEVSRLVKACDADLRSIVRGALLTGARRGDLVQMKVGDFKPDADAVTVQNSKSRYKGKTAYSAFLNAEGVAFFAEHTANRDPGQPMFLRADGKPWAPDDINRPLRAANVAAKIAPPAGMHTLRHTYASHAAMQGVPLMVIAQNLGHADTRMVEKHYAHLSPNYARQQIAKGLPAWGIVEAKNSSKLEPSVLSRKSDMRHPANPLRGPLSNLFSRGD